MSTTLTYAQAQIGDSLPVLRTKPISRTTLALFAGASGDHNPIHIDIDFAKAAGMPDVFAHGMLGMAYLGRLLTGWVGQSQLRAFTTRFVAITQIHAELTCTGTITDKRADNLVIVEIAATDQNGKVTLTGSATIELP